MMGDKGPGGGAAGNGVQHRGLHLNIAHVVQIIPHELDKAGTNDKIPLHLRVHDQVHIPLTVAQLLILKAVELLGQREQGLGQKGDISGPNAHLPPLGAENLAVYAHDITDIKLLELLIDLFIHLVLAGVELNAAVPVLKVTEAHLAHAPLGHEPADHLNGFALHGVKVVLDLLAGGVPLKPGLLEGILPRGLQVGELLPAQAQQLGKFGLLRGGVLLFLCHI